MRNSSMPHPLCQLVRDLRSAARMSLSQFEDKYGIPAVVVAAYERGDRIPPLTKIDQILSCLGYRLIAVPVDHQSVRLPGDIAAELHAIADMIAASAHTPDQLEPIVA